MKLISATIACSLALPVFAGEIVIAPEAQDDTEFDISQYIDALTVRAKYTNGIDLDDSPAEFDFTEISLSAFITKPIKLGGNWSAIALLDFRASSLDFDGDPLIGSVVDDIETDLYRVGIPVALYHNAPGSRWTYGAFINPAISSDFDHIDSDDFFLDAAVAVAYQVNERFVFGGGVYASDITEDAFVVPGIGFAWTPTDDWVLTYYGPRFIARHKINDRNQIGLEVATNGGSWNIDAKNVSTKLNLRSWRTGIYYRYNITGELWLQAAAGYTFANKLELQTRGGTDLFPTQLGDASGAPYAFIGLSVARW